MNFRELLARFGERWQALSQVRKTGVILAAIGVLVTLAVLGQILFSTPYAPPPAAATTIITVITSIISWAGFLK